MGGKARINGIKKSAQLLHIKHPKTISSLWLVKSCQFFPVRPSTPPKIPNFFQNVVGTLDPEYGWYHFQTLVGERPHN
jgi:hypothetical protein